MLLEPMEVSEGNPQGKESVPGSPRILVSSLQKPYSTEIFGFLDPFTTLHYLDRFTFRLNRRRSRREVSFTVFSGNRTCSFSAGFEN